MSELSRFKTAQADALNGFDVALRELRAGRKRGHWIWYVFPQLAGLGQSPMSLRYGVNGVEETAAYLNDPELRAHLVAVAEAVTAHLQRGVSVVEVMASEIDAVKLVSSMTLFVNAAQRVLAAAPPGTASELRALQSAGEAILASAAAHGIPPCAFTLARLNRELGR